MPPLVQQLMLTGGAYSNLLPAVSCGNDGEEGSTLRLSTVTQPPMLPDTRVAGHKTTQLTRSTKPNGNTRELDQNANNTKNT